MLRKFVAIFAALAFTIAGAFANNLGTLGTPTFQPLDVSFIGAVNNNTLANVNTVTFTGASVGTARGDRYVIGAIHFRDNAGTPTLSSVTVGGSSANILTTYNQSSNSIVGFFSILYPTGTTADITLNFGAATVDSAGVFVYTVNQLVRPFDIIGTGTLAATATNPAVISGPASEGGAVEFYILRNTSNATNTITPTESGTIGGGTCGTATGNCFSGFAINTSPTGGGVSDNRTTGSVGGLVITLR